MVDLARAIASFLTEFHDLGLYVGRDLAEQHGFWAGNVIALYVIRAESYHSVQLFARFYALCQSQIAAGVQKVDDARNYLLHF